MNPSTGNFLTMDTYKGSIYDPDTLHKYMYANGNPVTYSDPSGNSPIGEFIASTAYTIMNHAEEINLLGVLSGITNAMVTGLLGGSDMDITRAYIDGYLFGVAIGVGAVLLAAAVTDALLLAKFYAITTTAGSALCLGATIYAIMTNNKKAAIVYGIPMVFSLVDVALAYNYYYEIWLIGEKGVAAYSTADFSVAKGMNEGGTGTGNLTLLDGRNYSSSEINAAQYMASQGNDVILRPPVGTRADGGTSDLLVNGVNYDVYTPTTSNPSAIVRAITKKNTQTIGIVLDLSNTTVTADDLGNILARVKGAIEKNGGTCNINDIVIMPKKVKE